MEFIESGLKLVETIIINLDGEAIELNSVKRGITSTEGRRMRGRIRERFKTDNRTERGGEFKFTTRMIIGKLGTTIEIRVERIEEKERVVQSVGPRGGFEDGREREIEGPTDTFNFSIRGLNRERR